MEPSRKMLPPQSLQPPWREPKPWAVTLACISVAVLSGWFFHRDFGKGSFLNGPSIGKLKESSFDVKVKSAGVFTWTRGSSGTGLKQSDSVRTGQDARAIIELNTGAKIELAENSLFILDNPNQLDLSFLQGSIIIQDSKGSREVSQDPSGLKKTKVLTTRLTMNQTHFFISTDVDLAKIPIRWEPLLNKPGTASELFIESSRDRNFRKATLTAALNSSTGQNFIEKSFAPGVTYIRLKNAEKTQISEIKRIEVTHVEAIRPASLNIGLQSIDPISSVALTWTPPLRLTSQALNAAKHYIETAEDPEFTKPYPLLPSKLIFDPLELISKSISLKTGTTLFWRIVSEYPDTLLPFGATFRVTSSTATLGVTKIDRIGISKVQPQEQVRLAANQPLDFQWRTSPEFKNRVVQYQFELTHQNGDTKRFETSNLNHSISNLSVGIYSWRVISFRNGKELGTSDRFNLQINPTENFELISPTKDKQFLTWEKHQETILSWLPPRMSQGMSQGTSQGTSSTSSDLGILYEVEVSPSKVFPKNVTQTHYTAKSQTTLDLKVSEKPYFWRVHLAAENKTRLASSQVQSFSVIHPPPLAGPTEWNYPQNALFDLSQLDELPTLKHAPVPGAVEVKSTVLKVQSKAHSNVQGRSTAQTSEPAMVDFSSKENSFHFHQTLTEGMYQIRTHAVDPIGRHGPDTIFSFVVTYGKPLAPPRLKAIKVK